MKNNFLDFQKSVIEEFCKHENIDSEEIIKNYYKQYSEAKYHLLIESASMLCSESMYFPFFKRLKICKIILFGIKGI